MHLAFPVRTSAIQIRKPCSLRMRTDDVGPVRKVADGQRGTNRNFADIFFMVVAHNHSINED